MYTVGLMCASETVETVAAAQFAYLYYALKVCTLFVKKKYILLSM